MKYVAILLFFCFGCAAVNPGYKKRTFAYELGEEAAVVFYVPSEYKEEKFKVGDGPGLEQYYTYNPGSIFYISHKTAWPTINQLFIADTSKPLVRENEFIYSGTDESGFYWKEIRIDSLRFGYSFVPVNLLEQFEHTLNSIRIKRKYK